jgi:septal ring factor EnvC (AmiA/AmiB activator)
VSIAQDLRTRAKHRGKTPWQLVQTIGRLERASDAKDCELVAMATRIAELTAERNQLEQQLDEAAIDVSTALDDVRIARNETARAQDALTATRAQLANATAVSDLPQHTSTHPIPTVQQRFEQGHAIRLGASPMAATDPGRIPSWAKRDEPERDVEPGEHDPDYIPNPPYDLPEGDWK